MFDFNNYLTKSKYYYNLNKLLVGKMNNERARIVIEEFIRLAKDLFVFGR